MKKTLRFLAIISITFIALPNLSFAVDCSSPPSGFGGSWARAYRNWCESCGGTYSSSGPSCTPGPNWGGRQQQSPSYAPQPSYDYEAERLRQEEAERQRQRELEEHRKKEEEAAKKKQEEFEKNKQEALKNMKGVGEGELGLKGTDTGEDLGLKGIGETGDGSFGLKGIEDTKKLAPGRASNANCPKKDPKKPGTSAKSDIKPCPNLTCFTYFCGGGTECPYVCCPKGLPYLNHCDCKCYSSSDFECSSYSKCELQ